MNLFYISIFLQEWQYMDWVTSAGIVYTDQAWLQDEVPEGAIKNARGGIFFIKEEMINLTTQQLKTGWKTTKFSSVKIFVPLYVLYSAECPVMYPDPESVIRFELMNASKKEEHIYKSRHQHKSKT